MEIHFINQFGFFGNPLLQNRNATHWRILIKSFAHIFGNQIMEVRKAIEPWKTLSQVDGIAIRGQLGHDSKYGRAYIREFGRNHTVFGFGS
jgi:hypothetical protein